MLPGEEENAIRNIQEREKYLTKKHVEKRTEAICLSHTSDTGLLPDELDVVRLLPFVVVPYRERRRAGTPPNGTTVLTKGGSDPYRGFSLKPRSGGGIRPTPSHPPTVGDINYPTRGGGPRGPKIRVTKKSPPPPIRRPPRLIGGIPLKL